MDYRDNALVNIGNYNYDEVDSENDLRDDNLIGDE